MPASRVSGLEVVSGIQSEEMNISTVDDLSESAKGCTIDNIEETDEGVHINLSDGRVIILCDVSIVYLGNIEKNTLQ